MEYNNFCPQNTILPECSVQIANFEHYSEYRNSVTAEKIKKKIKKRSTKSVGTI
jgi:hypothetical protein